MQLIPCYADSSSAIFGAQQLPRASRVRQVPETARGAVPAQQVLHCQTGATDTIIATSSSVAVRLVLAFGDVCNCYALQLVPTVGCSGGEKAVGDMLKHFRGLTDETAAKSRFLAAFSAPTAYPQRQ